MVMAEEAFYCAQKLHFVFTAKLYHIICRRIKYGINTFSCGYFHVVIFMWSFSCGYFHVVIFMWLFSCGLIPVFAKIVSGFFYD